MRELRLGKRTTHLPEKQRVTVLKEWKAFRGRHCPNERIAFLEKWQKVNSQINRRRLDSLLRVEKAKLAVNQLGLPRKLGRVKWGPEEAAFVKQFVHCYEKGQYLATGIQMRRAFHLFVNEKMSLSESLVSGRLIENWIPKVSEEWCRRVKRDMGLTQRTVTGSKPPRPRLWRDQFANYKSVLTAMILQHGTDAVINFDETPDYEDGNPQSVLGFSDDKRVLWGRTVRGGQGHCTGVSVTMAGEKLPMFAIFRGTPIKFAKYEKVGDKWKLPAVVSPDRAAKLAAKMSDAPAPAEDERLEDDGEEGEEEDEQELVPPADEDAEDNATNGERAVYAKVYRACHKAFTWWPAGLDPDTRAAEVMASSKIMEFIKGRIPEAWTDHQKKSVQALRDKVEAAQKIVASADADLKANIASREKGAEARARGSLKKTFSGGQTAFDTLQKQTRVRKETAATALKESQAKLSKHLDELMILNEARANRIVKLAGVEDYIMDCAMAAATAQERNMAGQNGPERLRGIFKKLEETKDKPSPLPSEVYFATQVKAMTNTPTMLDEVSVYFADMRDKLLAKKKRLILVMDRCGTHVSKVVMAAIRAADIDLVLVPACCTDIAQPLDVGVNRPYKKFERDLRHKMTNRAIEANRKDICKSPGAIIAVGHEALSLVTRSAIINAWKNVLYTDPFEVKPTVTGNFAYAALINEATTK